MVTKKNICDALKAIIDDSDVTILPNRISNKDTKAISVKDSTLVRYKPIKERTMTFNQIAFALDIRYLANETETENFCWNLYKKIKDVKNLDLNEENVWLKTFKINEPYATGNVRNNIYEQRIEFAIIYSIGGH